MPEEVYQFQESLWPFVYEGVPYCIGDMSGEHRDAYMQDLATRSGNETLTAKPGEEVVQIRVMSFAGWSTALLQYCVYGYDANACRKLQLIPKDIISKWPNRLLTKLAEVAGDVTGTNATTDENSAAKKE